MRVTMSEQPSTDQDAGLVEHPEGDTPPKSKKKLIIIASAVLALVLIPVGLYFGGVFPSSSQDKKNVQAKKEGDHEDAAQNEQGEEGKEHAEASEEHSTDEEAANGQEPGEEGTEGEHGEKGKEGEHAGASSSNGIVYMELPEYLVNLDSSGKNANFLKLTIALELPNKKAEKTISPLLPKINDTFQLYLRDLRPEDLKGSAAMYQLREELLLRINKIAYPSQVNDLVFKEILVQ